jgi:hypothetical protein
VAGQFEAVGIAAHSLCRIPALEGVVQPAVRVAV